MRMERAKVRSGRAMNARLRNSEFGLTLWTQGNGGSGVHFRRSCRKAKQGLQESGCEGTILVGSRRTESDMTEAT